MTKWNTWKLTRNSNTQYHLVIGVVCTFFWLVKVPMWFLHVFYPVLSLLLHIALLILWAYGIHVQTAPDRIDPERINNGAPWYITKSCDIVDDKLVRSYCMQAKSSFAVSIIMLYVLPHPSPAQTYETNSPPSVPSTPSTSSLPATPSTPPSKNAPSTKPSVPKRKPKRRNGPPSPPPTTK